MLSAVLSVMFMRCEPKVLTNSIKESFPICSYLSGMREHTRVNRLSLLCNSCKSISIVSMAESKLCKVIMTVFLAISALLRFSI